MQHALHDHHGQTMVEYMVLAAVIGIAAISIYNATSDTVKMKAAASVMTMTGVGEPSTPEDDAKKAAEKASEIAGENAALGKFTNQPYRDKQFE